MTSDVTVRIARIDDAPFLTLLDREELGYDYPEKDTREKLASCLSRPYEKIFVAEIGGVPAGYAHAALYDVLYAGTKVNILGIAVGKAFKRRGAGRALLSSVEDWARAESADGVRLASGESRKDAHAFYRALGYESNKAQLRFMKKI